MVVDSLADTLLRYGDLISAAWIIAVTALLGKTAFFIFRRYIMGIKGNPGEELHEHIAGEVKWTFYVMVGSIGAYLAVVSISAFYPYAGLIDDMFVLFGVLLGAFIARKAINSLIVWYASKDQKKIRIERTALMSLRSLISIFIFSIAGIIILGQFGVEVTPLVASLGISGLAIALALQPTLSNYFAGLYIASDKTVRLGDYIELGEERRGYVEKMNWRSIWVRTVTDNIIVIPNSKLSESVVVNYSQPRKSMLFSIPVGVSYHSDLDKVEKAAEKVAKRVGKRTKTLVEGKDPFIRYTEFGGSNINFLMLFWIRDWDSRYALRNEFIKALKKEFDKSGIEISFPCTNVYMRT